MATSVPASSAIGFIGLGRMGNPMAMHLHRKFGPCGVWNRHEEQARKHVQMHGTTFVEKIEDFRAPVLFCCLPSSVEVGDVAEKVVVARKAALEEERAQRAGPPADPNGQRNTQKQGTSTSSTSTACHTLVDCTSGQYHHTLDIGRRLKEHGIDFVDCPVSGGPRGAYSATLTAMLGGDDQDVVAAAAALVSAFAPKREICGPLGTAHAVKAINNILNAANLATSIEGLLALKKIFGEKIDLEKALDCINRSSGRSLQSEVRVPEEVLSRRFGYGFDLQLMQKDCDAARSLLQGGEEGDLLPRVAALLDDAADFYKKECDEARRHGEIIDYTYIAKYLEERAGETLATTSEKI